MQRQIRFFFTMTKISDRRDKWAVKEKQLQRAIAAIEATRHDERPLSITAAARNFKVPKSTLADRISGRRKANGESKVAM